MCYKDFRLDGRVIIITGGAGLLGAQYVNFLSGCGARPIVADINWEAATALFNSLSGPGDGMALTCDVGDAASVSEMVHRVIEKFGRIDALVNNAAIDPKFDQAHHEEHTLTFENYPLDLWNESLKVDITGMFLCTQAVAPIMLQQKNGVIVNISSIYGMVGPDQRIYERGRDAGPPQYKPITYSVTKSAVHGFTHYLATYWAGKGIRVNTLTLGGVYNEHDAEFVQRYSARVPLGRMARRDEYCGALAFLLSDMSSYMTGANLVLDGGWTSW
jgi:NAD(P)-dependent dehydrogenase (short-subunit alcohol dehydrogenase family)